MFQNIYLKIHKLQISNYDFGMTDVAPLTTCLAACVVDEGVPIRTGTFITPGRVGTVVRTWSRFTFVDINTRAVCRSETWRTRSGPLTYKVKFVTLFGVKLWIHQIFLFVSTLWRSCVLLYVQRLKGFRGRGWPSCLWRQHPLCRVASPWRAMILCSWVQVSDLIWLWYFFSQHQTCTRALWFQQSGKRSRPTSHPVYSHIYHTMTCTNCKTLTHSQTITFVVYQSTIPDNR